MKRSGRAGICRPLTNYWKGDWRSISPRWTPDRTSSTPNRPPNRPRARNIFCGQDRHTTTDMFLQNHLEEGCGLASTARGQRELPAKVKRLKPAGEGLQISPRPIRRPEVDPSSTPFVETRSPSHQKGRDMPALLQEPSRRNGASCRCHQFHPVRVVPSTPPRPTSTPNRPWIDSVSPPSHRPHNNSRSA